MTSGIELIKTERERQISDEGWTADYDSQHTEGEMTFAAIAYIKADETDAPGNLYTEAYSFWPWSSKWWKPKDRIRNLVRAGALIAAEIDRLLELKGGEE